MVQNAKKPCPLHFISCEPYIIWLCFLLHKFKMITSPDVFFIFSKFWFSGLLGDGGEGVEGQKMTKNDKKIFSLCISGTVCDCGVWYTCVKWWLSPTFCFHFFKILFFLVFKCQKEILRCAPCFSHVCDFL